MKLNRRSFCFAAKLIVVLVVLTVALSVLAACATDKMKQAEKDGDNYKIVMSYDPETHTLSATQLTEVTNRTNNAFTKIMFHIYANAYREGAEPIVPNTYRAAAYPCGESYGNIAFDYVKVDDVACAFRTEGDNGDLLAVPLSQEMFPGDKVTVELTYKVTLANIKHRLGYTSNAVNCGNFFPIVCHIDNDNFSETPYYAVGDPFVSDCANFDVTVCAPSKFVVAASAQLTSVTSADGFDTWHYTGNARRDFAIVMSDKYKKLTSQVGDKQLHYYYFADAEPEATLAVQKGMFEYMNKHVGEYPYEQYSVCETDFCYGGMEYPCLAMVTSGQQAYKTAVIHETAHQWFYGVVGNDQIANPWMDEGLCEFLTCLYMDEAGLAPLENGIKAATKNYVTYVDVLNRYYDHTDTTFRPINAYKNDGEYVVMTYVKGCLLFDTLYCTMGKDKFLRTLADYYAACAFTLATPQQMTDCFVRRGGKEMATIFDNYASGKDIIGKVTD